TASPRLCGRAPVRHLASGGIGGSGMVVRGQHRTIERRLLPPRRSDIERRVGERRLELISLEEERRDQAERRQATDRRQPAGRRQGGVARGAKLVVLVVSDHDDEARRVRDLLEGVAPDRFGVAAAAPQASLARLARGGVDVVLLAMSLSARRGFATFTELRARAPDVPFLFLSDSQDERHGLAAVRAGAQDFLVKGDLDLVLRQTFRDADLVARIGGDEYAVLVRHAGPESAGVLADRLRRQVREFNRRAARPYQLSISLGFAAHKASTLGSVAGLLE